MMLPYIAWIACWQAMLDPWLWTESARPPQRHEASNDSHKD
jgi:hypothetical protein